SFSFDSGRVGAGEDGDVLSFNDVAILYRTDAQAAPLIEALGRSGIPFQKRAHRPLTDQAGVRAVLSILQKSSRGEGPVSVEALMDRTVLALAGDAEGSTERTSLLAAAELLRPLAVRFGDDLEGFLAAVATGGEVDTWDPRAERVSLLTLHAS